MLLTASQAKKLYQFCAENRVGMIAVNADGDSLIHDALLAAADVDAPVIIEASLWQLEGKCFGYGDGILGLKKYIADVALMASHPAFADVPVIFHIDHVPATKAVDVLTTAISGMPIKIWDQEINVYPSSVSFDATGLNDAENVKCVLQVAEVAKEKGFDLVFEVEPGIEDEPTEPEEAAALVAAIEKEAPGIIHLFAPAVGTRHGDTTRSGRSTFDADRVAKVKAAVEEVTGRPVGMALHGSSGLNDEQLRASVENGVTKINTCTFFLGARARAKYDYLVKNHDRIQMGHKDMKEASKDPTIDTAVSEVMVPLIAERMKVSNAAGYGKKALEYIFK
jgi:fructose-bisphosphate aldolase class II